MNYKKVFLPGFKKMFFIYEKKWSIYFELSLGGSGIFMVEAAFTNLYLLCSDCPNGPSKFLNYGKNGILFKSDLKDSLYKSLMEFDQFNSERFIVIKLF